MESHNESSAQQLRQRAAGNQFKQPQSEFDFAGIHNTHESTKILIMCADTSGQEQKGWESMATYFLEGILTPLVSSAGVLGKISLIRESFNKKFISPV